MYRSGQDKNALSKSFRYLYLFVKVKIAVKLNVKVKFGTSSIQVLKLHVFFENRFRSTGANRLEPALMTTGWKLNSTISNIITSQDSIIIHYTVVCQPYCMSYIYTILNNFDNLNNLPLAEVLKIPLSQFYISFFIICSSLFYKN